MTITDNNGTDNTAVPIDYNNLTNGIIVTVAVGSNADGLNPYSVTISPAPGNTTFTTPVVLTGSENGPIQQADLFDQNTDGNAYFNNLSITAEAPVPEPATIGLLGVSTLFLAARRRRNRAV
jgi:PEP-CTERM motif